MVLCQCSYPNVGGGYTLSDHLGDNGGLGGWLEPGTGEGLALVLLVPRLLLVLGPHHMGVIRHLGQTWM